ncbi:MAG: 4Fe-4S binding protein [Chloroflexi bacterium]|nr:4Fe-4S binding protein [Chloroflexota bacterium]
MLVFDADKCVNCHYCEKVCSCRWVGQIKPAVSAIQIDRLERFGPISARVCDLCTGRAAQECIVACPTGALKLQDVVRFDKDLCTQCLACVGACPRHAVAFDEAQERIVVCDLCDGQPLCAAWCPENVVSMEGVPA